MMLEIETLPIKRLLINLGAWVSDHDTYSDDVVTGNCCCGNYDDSYSDMLMIMLLMMMYDYDENDDDVVVHDHCDDDVDG